MVVVGDLLDDGAFSGRKARSVIPDQIRWHGLIDTTNEMNLLEVNQLLPLVSRIERPTQWGDLVVAGPGRVI